MSEDKSGSASSHYSQLRRELNPSTFKSNQPKQPSPVHQPPAASAKKSAAAGASAAAAKPCSKLPKQMSLNDEMFCSDERKREKAAVRERIKRQQSLPCEKPDTRRKNDEKKSIMTAASASAAATAVPSQFDVFRERFSKLREPATKDNHPQGGGGSGQDQRPARDVAGRGLPPNKSFTHGLVKILHRWKSEHEPTTAPASGGGGGGTNKSPIQASFTRKKGVNIDPIMVFGLRRDQSLDSATRRGLFHKKGAWSPKSPKVASSETSHSPLENPCLLSPTVRRCCMECPSVAGDDSVSLVERRLSRGEVGSDSSKDSSIQSDTSLDSEDSCISVIFVPHPELKSSNATAAGADSSKQQSPQSQRSTSNSSESSESPTGRGSPMSPGSKLLSPSKMHAKTKLTSKLTNDNNSNGHDRACNKAAEDMDKLPDIKECDELDSPDVAAVAPQQRPTTTTPSSSTGTTSTLPRIPEHKSFELEDLPIENPINCHPLGHAQRVEIMKESEAPLSPRPIEDTGSSRFDYPIVKHHPLFAKTHRSRGGISSLLLGENIEFRRKPGQSSCQGVQTVVKSTPKLLTFEIYNPETDDLDSDTSLSSSPDSEDSIVSVISDTSRAVPTKLLEAAEAKETTTDEPNQDSCHEDTIFKFDPEDVQDSSKDTADDAAVDDKSEEVETSYDKEEMERKSEQRKKELINLLGENKNVFQNINRSKIKTSEDIKCVVQKTASQLQSMEELRLPQIKRGKACASPDFMKECKSEPILYTPKEVSQQSSLDSISSLTDPKQDNNKSAEEPIQPVVEVKAKDNEDSLKIAEKQVRVSTLVKMKMTAKKIDEDKMPEIVISDASEAQADSNQPESLAHQESSQSSTSLPVPPAGSSSTHQVMEEVDHSCDTTTAVASTVAVVESEKEKSISESPSPKSFEEKLSESSGKSEAGDPPLAGGGGGSQSIVPFRRLERNKKRDDSLESNTPSVKSSVYASDTGSVLSHRFSTISISSNLSSDVSFGNNSGVSGSSCYLASMSSADFDDRPPLASSFSLSEAEENEYLSSLPRQADTSSSTDKQAEAKAAVQPTPISSVTAAVKKDQLSPPKPEQKTPKLKSLFKRNSDSKSRSTSHDSKKSLQSSCEGARSRDGGSGGSEELCGGGSKPRSRIGSALTPDTSLEQTTCVERCSTSFEEELMRSFNKEDKEELASPSDSEGSAEAGGSLTHHRLVTKRHTYTAGQSLEAHSLTLGQSPVSC